ncbi:MAG: FecR domain-containing protein, partial [Bdellovibrionales bacterium]
MKTILAFLFLAGSMASASQQASIVAAKGNTQILTLTPSTPSSARVKFEDKVYYVQKARIGAKLKGQDIVHTGPDGQLKAIYPSGELIFVGPGSAFAMPTVADQGSTTKGGTANLIYGKIRSLVTKQGSLKHFEVKTPAAVAGVRGTDFFVGYNGITGSTVTVLRGEVEVKTTSTANVAKSEPQVATVKPGFTAAVPVAPKTE